MKQLEEHLILELVDDKIPSAGSKIEVEWRCSSCGYQWFARPNNRSRGAGCPECAKTKQINSYKLARARNNPLPSEWQEELVDNVLLSKHSYQEVRWRCKNNHIWYASPAQRGRGKVCKQCRIEQNPLPSILYEQLVDKKEYSAGAGDMVEWQCEHGHRWFARVVDRTRSLSFGHEGCGKCSGRSTEESKLANFVQSLTTDAVLNNRTILNGLELDILLPPSIAIEYNGLYWHREDAVGKYYHFNKWKKCNDKGIQLIQIWEDDWLFNQDVIKRFIAAKINGRTSIGARHTKVVELTYQQASAFLKKHHVLGSSRGRHYVGLITDELVAVMVVNIVGGIARIDRFASSVSIPGGLDKAMKHLGYQQWVTFADHCVSNGSLYEKTGWTKDKILRPDYWYVYNKRRIHKFNFRKKRFKAYGFLYDESLTESELAKLNNLYRVYDAGKTRYIKTI